MSEPRVSASLSPVGTPWYELPAPPLAGPEEVFNGYVNGYIKESFVIGAGGAYPPITRSRGKRTVTVASAPFAALRNALNELRQQIPADSALETGRKAA